MENLFEIEKAIRRGNPLVARKLLGRLSREGMLGKFSAAKIGNFFWRLGEPARGLKILSRTLPDLEPGSLDAFPDEAAEYSACLIRMGAIEEARWILEQPKVQRYSRAHLYRGFSFLETWNYAEAVHSFRQFVSQEGIPDYWRRVGLVNLAASLVYEKNSNEAYPILRGLLHDSRLSQNVFLMGYTLEVAAADRVLVRDFKRAEKLFDEAETRWSSVDGWDRFFLKKWRVFLSLFRDGDKRAVAQVDSLKTEAKAIHHWETVRDCDRYQALCLKDENLFFRAYFGTPYEAFRKRLHKDFGKIEIPEKFLWSESDNPKPCYDILINESDTGKKLPEKQLAILSIFSSDFYRPFRLGTLFSRIFTDEHFHFSSSPKRMHEAIRRFSAAVKKSKLSVSIREDESSYQLVLAQGVGFWVSPPGDTHHGWSPMIVRLTDWFKGEWFATKDVIKQSTVPRRTLVRQLQSLLASGHLEKRGDGVSQQYRVVKPVSDSSRVKGAA